MEAFGFERGMAAPTMFYHRERDVRLVVWGTILHFSDEMEFYGK